MTVAGVEVRSQVSLGTILNIIVLVAALGSMWGYTENRVSEIAKEQSRLLTTIDRERLSVEEEMIEVRSRVAALEISTARTEARVEQKFENILAILSRIEKRMDDAN